MRETSSDEQQQAELLVGNLDKVFVLGKIRYHSIELNDKRKETTKEVATQQKKQGMKENTTAKEERKTTE